MTDAPDRTPRGAWALIKAGPFSRLWAPAMAPAGLPGRYDHVFRYHNRRTGDEVASRLGPDHTDAAGP